MRKIPVLLSVVEAVADDEVILDREADVLDGHVDLPARRLAQQTRRAQRFRIARAENLVGGGERQTGVDDVVDDNDVASVERQVEVLEASLHLTSSCPSHSSMSP